MYRVFCDEVLLYHSQLENMKMFNPSLELELNKTGSFVFTIYPEHPRYTLINKLKSIITVYQDDYLLFRGRVLDDEIGWYNEKTCVCEGDLAFLLDSIQRPVNFTGTVTEFLSHITNSHNSQVEPEKRFVIGSVTVEGDVNVTLEDYPTTLETAQKTLIDTFGGYLKTRTEDGVTYLDYLSSINLLSPQTIQFGKNLLDLKRIRKGSDIATALIPIGKDGLTIASVNNGLDYIVDTDAQAQFRFIVKKANFNDIDDATELLKAGKAQLADIVNYMETIELTAADLAAVDEDFESFHIGAQVRVTSDPHGINQLFTVSKISIKLLDPTANKLVLGKTINTFSESVVFPKGEKGKDGQDAVTLRIDSSRGTVFKNSEVSTVLNVVIFKGGKTITDAVTMRTEFGSGAYLEWQWQRMGEETFGTILATDSRISDDGFSLSLNPADVDTKVVFKCQLVTE